MTFMNKRAQLILLGFGILVLSVGLAVISIHPIARYQEWRCREQLKVLGYEVQVYQSDYAHLPRQLSDLSNRLNPILLTCPGSGHVPGSFTNADSWADYTFIDWPGILGTNVVPKDYPIAYDRFMSNHGNRGINVLTVFGFVRWDANAEWLRKYAEEHPEVKLRIPQ